MDRYGPQAAIAQDFISEEDYMRLNTTTVGERNAIDEAMPSRVARRRFLQTGGILALSGFIGVRSFAAWAGDDVVLPFANGQRPLVSDFPHKGPMILQRTRPPLLETPFEVFDNGVFTPNAQFFVRWHLPSIPTTVQVDGFTLKVFGNVDKPLSLSLEELLHGFEPIQVAAVNQCSGNSRGFFNPRVAGAQWANGAMGNALWTGVRLKDVLDRAGVKAGSVQVRFHGLDKGVIEQTPQLKKALDVDHARDGEVMIAYAMNGEQLPLLNGFPLRLVVPGWYSTYWVKMLTDIEVLDRPDDNYWMAKAYLIPDTPFANVTPDETGVKLIPINRMGPRSFLTNLRPGASIRAQQRTLVRGIAFGGDTGVSKVLVSADEGVGWREARLGKDYGKYSFRQ